MRVRLGLGGLTFSARTSREHTISGVDLNLAFCSCILLVMYSLNWQSARLKKACMIKSSIVNCVSQVFFYCIEFVYKYFLRENKNKKIFGCQVRMYARLI